METVDNRTKNIYAWLIRRGISPAVLSLRNIDIIDGQIVIPIPDMDGNISFYKYRRDPIIESALIPKYTYSYGALAALYPIDNLLKKDGPIIICEGEFDALLLETLGFNAITSTGGALTFKKEWAELFAGKETYVCFDNDKAGKEGIIKVCSIIPHAKVIPLPDEIGEHGDITDYFIKLKKNPKDFRILIDCAYTIKFPPKEAAPKKKVSKRGGRNKLESAKQIPLENFIQINHQGFAHCPFHGRDSNPSFKVYPDNHFYCFGCGARGDVIDFIQRSKDLPLSEAIKFLLE